MSNNNKKQPAPISFQRGNFSCMVNNFKMTKAEFVAAHKGKLTTDINNLYDDVMKAKAAWEKENKPAETAKKSDEKPSK